MTEAVLQWCSCEKFFSKCASNLQEKTHTEMWFQLLKPVIWMGVLLKICSVFSEHLVRRKPLGDCSWTEVIWKRCQRSSFALLILKCYKKLKYSRLQNISQCRQNIFREIYLRQRNTNKDNVARLAYLLAYLQRQYLMQVHVQQILNRCTLA